MDYEKKYNETLERAKGLLEIVEEDKVEITKDDVKSLFPELRESEDEQVRKSIVATIEQCPDDFLNPKNRDKMLAYLERQKEQKPKMTPKWLYRLEFRDSSCGLWYDGYGKWCFESGIGSISGCKTKTLPMDYDARYKQDGRDWFSSCSRKEDLMHWYSLEDAKELISKGFVFTRYLATEYHEYEQQTVFIKETALYREEIDIFELLGQKPAEWSEEDKTRLTNILIMLKEYLIHHYSKDDIDKSVDWLESLPERFNLQPKQEWSEEDEAYRNFILESLEDQIRFCKKDAEGAYYAKQIRTAQNWLKSLRPQSHWKPSEEQMTALDGCLEHWSGNKSQKEILESLYEHLKKL